MLWQTKNEGLRKGHTRRGGGWLRKERNSEKGVLGAGQGKKGVLRVLIISEYSGIGGIKISTPDIPHPK